jgi:hypothetical protein
MYGGAISGFGGGEEGQDIRLISKPPKRRGHRIPRRQCGNVFNNLWFIFIGLYII